MPSPTVAVAVAGGVIFSLNASHLSPKKSLNVSFFDGITSIPARNPATVAPPAIIHGCCRVHSRTSAPSATARFMSASTAEIAVLASSC